MKILISPSELRGSIQVPPSKSAFIRAVAAAALSEEKTIIRNPSYSADGIAALQVAEAMGAEVESFEDRCLITGKQHALSPVWNVDESGLAARLFIPIAALESVPIRIEGEGSLMQRPLGIFDQLLPEFGVKVKSNKGFLPMEVQGPLQSGEYHLDASMSSQHVSALLFALAMTDGKSRITADNMKSTTYVEMTLEMLESFGIQIERVGEEEFVVEGNQKFRREELTIDGDWSAGATLLCAGAIAGADGFEVSGLETEFKQADKDILGVLLFSGSKIKNQSGDYQITTHGIKGFKFDATDCPDLFPALAALAVFADRESRIAGVHRLVHKESNRGKVIVEELTKAGISAKIRGDELIIEPGVPKSCEMDSHGDHRIAMMATLIGLGGAEITLTGSDAVQKSYPNFYADLIDAGAKIKMI